MKHINDLISCLNKLNQNGRIQYDDYSELFDMVCELKDAEAALSKAEMDISALLRLNGNCEYCKHGEKEEFSGTSVWHCRLGNGVDCRPIWRGVAQNASVPAPRKAEPIPVHTKVRAKPSRAETMFGPKETWTIHDKNESTGPKTYKGFLLIRCARCGELRGFCAKQPISSYRCAVCEGETPLRNLVPAYVNCKCGAQFKYRTNMTGCSFTYKCLHCGAPVDMEYNEKARTYQTVR